MSWPLAARCLETDALDLDRLLLPLREAVGDGPVVTAKRLPVHQPRAGELVPCGGVVDAVAAEADAEIHQLEGQRGCRIDVDVGFAAFQSGNHVLDEDVLDRLSDEVSGGRQRFIGTRVSAVSRVVRFS